MKSRLDILGSPHGEQGQVKCLRRAWPAVLGVLLALVLTPSARATLQFDVFLGYDGIVSEASWFPLVIEVDNDGPTFTGIIEITGGSDNESQPVRMPVELPTGTLKRLVIPLFSAYYKSFGYGYGGVASVDVRLYDDRGKVRAEQLGARARRETGVNVPLLGALARTATGTPVIRPVLPQDPEMQPGSARLLPALFPDDPLVLEGLDALYLNSAKAADLGVTQVEALQDWLHAGGHLIIGVEQITEISAATWLRDMFPCELKDMKLVARHGELQDWVKAAIEVSHLNHYHRRPGGPHPQSAVLEEGYSSWAPFIDLPLDSAFETNALQVAVGNLRDGKAVVTCEGTPLMITANRGRGRLTVLLFSPEREPFRSWKNEPTFWAKLLEVPPPWYTSADYNRPSGWSSDALFGAMVDTRQVHKLPVEWLLVLLLVYLVVIGPLDQHWLKRIGKPMLTWITFPCYVIFFSLLIYFIGYKLRAGESEWTELNVVDVLPRGDGAELRGRTYASIYSPANQKYSLQGQQGFTALRGEFAGTFNNGQPAAERATIWRAGDGFKAEVFVPVWTSQLFVNDWWQPADLPLSCRVKAAEAGWTATVENRTDHKLTDLRLVVDGRIYELNELAPHETKSFEVNRAGGRALAEYVHQHGPAFNTALAQRRKTFGDSSGGHLDDLADCTAAVSFISQIGNGDSQAPGYQGVPQNTAAYIAPPGLDLTPLAEHGSAILLAWAGDYAPQESICRFKPRRMHRSTMWRVATTVEE